MGDSGAPLGRELEHEQTLGLFDRLDQGAAGLVLVGDAGIGKTTIFEAGLADARRRGCRVLICRPSASEMRSSFAGLGDLLEGTLDDALPQLAAPQAQAIKVALGLSQTDTPLEARLLGRAVLGVLRTLCGDGRVLVAVDDLQWLDPASAEALVFAIRRLADESVGFLATVRGSESAPLPLDLERGLADRLDRVAVGPLSIGAVQRLLRERLGVRLPRPLLRRVHELAGGNPFYALELGRGLAERGDERLPASLRGLVADRIERLPESSQRLLVVLAAAAHPTVALVGSLDAKDALDAAEQEGIVACEDRRIRFSHPLLAAAAWERATSRERREAHSRLAQLVEDPEQQSRHLALGADGPDEATAIALEEAAAAAFGRGAPTAAVELAEHALALTQPSDHAAVQRRRLSAARHHETAGNGARQRELVELVLEDATDDRERGAPLWQLAVFAMEDGDVDRARTMVDEAIRCAAGDDSLLATIHLNTSWLDHFFFGSVERAEAALEHAEQSGDPLLQAEALGVLGGALFSRGLGLRRDLFERAIGLEERIGFLQAANRPTTYYGWCAKWAGDISLGRELLERSAAKALADEDATANAPLFYLSWLHIIAGEWDRAVEVATESHELSLDAGLGASAAQAAIALAVVAAFRGQLSEAEERLAEAERHTQEMGQLWEYTRALVAFVGDDPTAAVAELATATEQMQASEVEEPGLFLWFPLQAEALVQIGRLDEAEELTEWLDERAVRLERRWALAVCAHSRGAIAGARGDVDGALQHVERAMELHEGTARPFDRACTLLLQGQLLRRAKQRRRARETLDAALAEFDRLGAAPWAARTRAELGRLGGRTRTQGLTPTEEKLAALVAAGRSNKQIAGELFVTVRTVETNLSRIYAKLGLRSRGELTAWLSGRS